MDKRLTLSQNDKMISGVCGGIGEYFKIDPTVIRIIIIFYICRFTYSYLYYILDYNTKQQK